MAHNAVPAFCKNGNLGTPCVLTAANTKSDGAGTIGTDIFLAFTADSTNGSLVEYVRFVPTATVAATATTLTTARIFVSSLASGATTAANTTLLKEVQLPVQTADHSTTPTNEIDVPLNIRLPASYTILVTTHVVPVANTGWKATAIGGDY